MSFSPYSGHIPRCQHIKTNGTQCGSPALKRKRFCYFHNRWRVTSINLKRTSAARCASILELPVLEDADSIPAALMQILRLILSRQFDSKTGGLMLYGLQIASSNLRHLDLEPRHKPDVVIDPRTVCETSVGEGSLAREACHHRYIAAAIEYCHVRIQSARRLKRSAASRSRPARRRTRQPPRSENCLRIRSPLSIEGRLGLCQRGGEQIKRSATIIRQSTAVESTNP